MPRTDVHRLLTLPAFVIGLVALGQGLWLFLGVRNPYGIAVFDHLYLVQDLPGTLFHLLLLGLAVPLARRIAPEAVERPVRWLGDHPWRTAAVAAPLFALAAVFVYRQHPLSMDEYTAVFQARLFAAGRLWAELPPPLLDWLIPRYFLSHFFRSSAESGQVISAYWPGFSLLLAPFAKLGAPWLLNPLLGAGTLVLLARCARELDPGGDAAGWALFLGLASPQLTAYAISYYSMAAHLACNLLFSYLLLRPSPDRAFAAGAVGSLALVLHQPVPHLLYALPWIAWLAFRPGRWRRLGALAAGYLPLVAALGFGWWRLTSRVAAGGGDALAAGAAPSGDLARLLEGVAKVLLVLPGPEQLHDRFMGLLKLALWAVPGLLPLAVLGFWRGRGSTAVRLFAASAFLTLGGYFFVPLDQGHGWGYRYFHQAWGVLPILGAVALARVHQQRATWVRLVGVLALASLVAGTGLRLEQVGSFVGRHLEQMPPVEAGRRQVVFLDTRRGYYKLDLVQNDPLLRDPVLVFHSHGREADEALVRDLFPGARRSFDDGRDTVWRLD